MRARRSYVGVMLFLLGLAWPAGLSADSDGYYCAGPGYLAFQLRSWNTDGPHLLRLIRFGDGRIREAGQVELPDFQPHAMRCEGDRVRIVGWAWGYIEVSIDVSGEPRVTETIEDPDRPFAPAIADPEMTNLGDWAVPGTMTLSATLSAEDSRHEYRLVITRRSSPVSGGLEHHTRSLVVAVDRSGEVVGELLVYEGTSFESVH